jgi:hypothetical protein
MAKGMEMMGAQAPWGTLDEVQPQRISPKSQVDLESPRARMLSQYLGRADIMSSANRVRKYQIRVKNSHMIRVRALIDCGATSIFMACSLVKRFGISHEAAQITTLGINRKVIQHEKVRRRMWITVLSWRSLTLVDECVVLVVLMHAYDLVFGEHWFQRCNPNIHMAH